MSLNSSVKRPGFMIKMHKDKHRIEIKVSTTNYFFFFLKIQIT